MAGEWAAAAGEGGPVDRDWSNNVTNKDRGSKTLLVVVDVCQSASHSPYSFYKALNEKPGYNFTNDGHEHTSHIHPMYINRNTTRMKKTGIVIIPLEYTDECRPAASSKLRRRRLRLSETARVHALLGVWSSSERNRRTSDEGGKGENAWLVAVLQPVFEPANNYIKHLQYLLARACCTHLVDDELIQAVHSSPNNKLMTTTSCSTPTSHLICAGVCSVHAYPLYTLRRPHSQN